MKTNQIGIWASYLLMITANILANALPINGKNTGEVSAQYPNLFVPAGLTFSIWGLIYLFLLIFCLQQSPFFSKQRQDIVSVRHRVAGLFCLNSIANASWIVAWHYEQIVISVALILLILWSLVKINLRIKGLSLPYSAFRVTAQIAFGIYLGWICVATIANMTALMVALKWGGGGISPHIWSATLVGVGGVLGFGLSRYFNNISIAAVMMWAFLGIIIARNKAEVYHADIVYVCYFVLLLLLIGMILQIKKSLSHTENSSIRP